MEKKLRLLIYCLLFATAPGWAQNIPGRLEGVVLDKSSKEPIPFANILVKENGIQKGGANTDFDGRYDVTPLTAGTYSLEVSYVGYQKQVINGVVISSGRTTRLNVELNSTTTQLDEVLVFEYAIPLIEPDNTTTGARLSGEDVEKLPSRDLSTIITTQAGAFSADDGQALNVKGNRSDANQYFVNGVKIFGPTPNIPVEAISELNIITGGVPAQYGDAVGGIISITTRSASNEYFGGLSYETSRPFNEYQQDILNANVSGPILTRKVGTSESSVTKETVLGFFAAAQYQRARDFSPPAGDVFILDGAVRERVEERPLVRAPGGSGFLYATELLTRDSLSQISYRPNNGSQDVLFNGSLDFQPTSDILITVGGNLQWQQDRIAGAQSLARTATFYRNSVFNSDNNGLRTRNSYNAFLRFTQNFRRATADTSGSLIKNAYYQVQLDYSRDLISFENETFGDDIFRYNYIGQFEERRGPLTLQVEEILQDGQTQRVLAARNEDGDLFFQIPEQFPLFLGTGDNFIEILDDRGQPTGERVYVDRLLGSDSAANPNDFYLGDRFRDTDGNLVLGSGSLVLDNALLNGVGFTPSGDNPIMANYTEQVLELADPVSYGLLLQNRGLLNGINPVLTYNLFDSPGDSYSNYRLFDREQFRVSALGNADIGNHSLRIGFEYEQRIESDFEVFGTGGLWGLGASLLNDHLVGNAGISGVRDVDGNTVLDFTVGQTGLQDGVNNSQSEFDRRLRSQLGLDVNGNDIIDIHSLTPDQLSLGLFTADNLIRNSLVEYRGYNYLGERVRDNTSYEDFFLDTLNRPHASFQPVYASVYVEDKFQIDDLILRLGLRVDRYDANQEVLSDPFSFAEVVRAGELANRPAGIGDDFAVYINQDAEDLSSEQLNDIRAGTSPISIVGYRDTEGIFYDAQGRQLATPQGTIDVNGNYFPALIAPNASDPAQTEERRVFDESGITFGAFEDYTPQINVMPRVSFSFPISEEALFFAHYDVLTQRPDRNAVELYDIYRLRTTQGLFLSNPDLRPQRKVDYQLGFQQRLTRSSALKISAFYSELRDQIQLVNRFFAYPRNYQTWGNVDFGTVKGFIFQYDLRRTKNLAINASYTLQFADGTASDDIAAFDLIRFGQPNLRSPNPLGFDQRHAFKVNLDYRYDDDQGPTMFGVHPLENFGVNFTIFAGSGTPYSRLRGNPIQAVSSGVQQQSRLAGGINGSRLPWNARAALRVNKSFMFQSQGSRRSKTLDVYVYIENVFDTRNVLNVYQFSGLPDDDGYLTSAVGQQRISQLPLAQQQPFTDIYDIRQNNPANFSLPRRARLGIAYSF